MNQISSPIKNILLLAGLLIVVMIVNLPLFSFNMIYQEQATIYLANQTITTWQDLLNIYLHPAWLNINIPFFRPSGHFLIYQLLMPLLGWHNTTALNVISFSFLALTGFFSIQLYKLLFDGFYAGAFIAFAIYLMHPSLSISRLTFMHFDFAYVFFLILSLYLFVLFCKKNTDKIPFDHFSLFGLSLLFYAIAVTFKEPAIMLGPVLFCYFCISFYNILYHKKSLLILLTITATSVLLSWYLFLSWPSLKYAGNSFSLSHSLGTANVFIKDIFAVSHNFIPLGSLPFQDFAWRTTVFTPASRYVMWLFFWLSLACTLLVIRDKKPESENFRKSLLFLFLSSLLFLFLPLCWASGAPWHHSLTLIFLSIIMGFSAEYFLRSIVPTRKTVSFYCLLIAILLAWIGITVNFENTIKYYLEPNGFLGISLNRNAILSPPDIRNKLNKDSIIVVEDSLLHNDYFLGNSAYPLLLFFNNQDYDKFQHRQENFYLKYHPVYSGNLFRYAYLLPTLKEELYPFQIELMDEIPNEIIYNWLKNYNNIFCLGYDSAANWHDKTKAFKTALARQQSLRHLTLHSYQAVNVNSMSKNIAYTRQLSLPDIQLCQFICDQNKQCKGFIYSHALIGNHHKTQCDFRHGDSR